MRLSRHFVLNELKCSCGKCETTASDIDSNLVYNLEKLRDAFGLPLKINSGYRCEDHNKAVGGAKNSQHKYGKAADISTKHFNSEDKYRLIQLIFRMNTFTGIGIHRDFIHVDTRKSPKPIVWVY